MRVRRWFAALLVLVAACTGRPRSGLVEESDSPETNVDLSGRQGEVLELDLTNGAPETMNVGGLFQLPASRTFVGLVRTIERAEKNTGLTGVYVRLGGTSLGWARTEELGRLLGGIREGGTPVVCHAYSLDNASAWLVARGCDRIWLSPGGEVNTVGIAAQVLYFKGALDKLKVRAQFIAAGKYKSAAESFTREGPSDEARESLISTLASMRQTWLAEVKASRKAHQQLGESLEHGPWTAQEAKARGLVDAIGFETEARKEALERGSARETEVKFGPKSTQDSGSGLAELIRVLAGTDDGSGGPPHIVVLPAQGAIKVQSEGLFGDGGIAAKALTKTLRRLAKDKSVKAVVLRIDSPGGSALASDLMWHEVMQLRKKKPVIASIGDMAASGGYYIAAAAHKIIAERTSIVGSIGVFGGKVTVDEALAHFGVNSVTFPASPEPGAAERAAYLSPLAPWDEATQGRVKKQIENIYDLFLKRVAEGRGMKIDAVRKSAEGRIWSGVQGKERGLVDEFGGLARALELARQMGKVDEDAPVRVEGAVESLLELLMLGDAASSTEVTAAVQRLESQRGQAWSTIPAPVRPFISSLEPLLLGERMLATMPFAVMVK